MDFKTAFLFTSFHQKMKVKIDYLKKTKTNKKIKNR